MKKFENDWFVFDSLQNGPLLLENVTNYFKHLNRKNVTIFIAFGEICVNSETLYGVEQLNVFQYSNCSNDKSKQPSLEKLLGTTENVPRTNSTVVPGIIHKIHSETEIIVHYKTQETIILETTQYCIHK